MIIREVRIKIPTISYGESQIARINITVIVREMLIVVNRCTPTLELCQQSERAVIMINSCVERGKERSWI